MPLGILGAIVAAVLLLAGFLLFCYFMVLVVIGGVTFFTVAGLGTFVLISMLTMPKSEFDVFLASWSKAVVIGWYTFEKIDIMTVIAAEFGGAAEDPPPE